MPNRIASTDLPTPGAWKKAAVVVAAVGTSLIGVAVAAPVTTSSEAGAQTSGGFKGMG